MSDHDIDKELLFIPDSSMFYSLLSKSVITSFRAFLSG